MVRRSVLVVMVALAGLLALSGTVSAQGNSEAARACKEGGYVNYTDTEGNPFENAGACVSYAAEGYELVPVVVVVPSIDLQILHRDGVVFDYIITGAGLDPETDVILKFYNYFSVLLDAKTFPVAADGTISVDTTGTSLETECYQAGHSVEAAKVEATGGNGAIVMDSELVWVECYS